MLLRNSISNTKKFFQKTLQGFKSFFSCGSYEKLPKSHPFINPFRHGNREDSNIHSSQNVCINAKEFDDFTDRWEGEKKQPNKRTTTKRVKKPKMVSAATTTTSIQEAVVDHLNGNGNSTKLSEPNATTTSPFQSNSINYGGKRANITREQLEAAKLREERACMVAQKLKELEMMDVGNVDLVLDIEEVLHYYSRLTCPAYLEIVDKFFLEMCAEFFNGRIGSTHPSVDSRPTRLINSVR